MQKLVLIALSALVLNSVATAQFEINWSTIEGGGGTSTGGTWTLSGTIGQPDAGVVMTGGDKTLVGGFWAGVSTTTGTLLGDANCDGLVNGQDIDCFVDALVSGSECVVGCSLLNADVNQDGAVNALDIDTFVDCIVGGGCP